MGDTLVRREYSAKVQMTLCVAGICFDIAQMGGELLRFREPILLPGGAGELSLSIDGHVRRWDVRVPEMTEASEMVAVEFVGK